LQVLIRDDIVFLLHLALAVFDHLPNVLSMHATQYSGYGLGLQRGMVITQLKTN